MLTAQLILSFLAISQLLYTSVYFLSYHRAQLLGKLYALYSFCLLAYVADNLPLLDGLPLLNHTASLFAILSPGVFWVISRFYFEDKPVFPWWVIALIPLYTILRLAGVIAEGHMHQPPMELLFLFFILPNVVMLGFAGHIVMMAVQGRSADLVEQRRKLRLPFAVIMAALLLVIIGLETLLLPNGIINNAFFALLFVLALIFNIQLPKLEQSWLAQLPSTVGQPQVDNELSASEQALIARLLDAMQKQYLYRNTGLTISALAKQLAVSEHKLRRLINHQLKYRNFNQFINHYRIKDASERLLEQQELPILTIALEVGYGSLSSFNKAFLAAHGMTPSEFRQNH